MCGIWLYLHRVNRRTLTDGEIYSAFMKIKQRGPDRSIFRSLDKYGLHIGFHRLSIMDVTTRGDQPFIIETDDKIVYTICNGEIYNYNKLSIDYDLILKSGSDCEVLSHLYMKIGIDEMIKKLQGEFSFCICEIDKLTDVVTLYIGRDQCGIRPLFITGSDDEIVLTSTLKGSPFLEKGYGVKQFPPRCYLKIMSSDEKLFDETFEKITHYIEFDSILTAITDLDEAKIKIRNTLMNSVKTKMISDRSLGCLLSGGLDSSLIASIASRWMKCYGQALHTFSIGMPGSTDEKFAKMVSAHIGSIHTHVEFSQEDFINAIDKVVEVIESYDITTVRASTGQYLISKWIAENTDIKVLLIGDGSDELCSGYMYFHKAPSAEEMHAENIRLINDIHMYDVLRADRGIATNGIEARVPFLDTAFVKLYLSIDPALRMPTKGIEKWLLRESFAETGLLPTEVLYRPKEAFSDGCSSQKKSWYSIIQEHIKDIISDEELSTAQSHYTHCVPPSKEALYFRKTFETLYGTSETTAKVIPYYWLPKWSGNITEPSARVLEVYKKND